MKVRDDIDLKFRVEKNGTASVTIVPVCSSTSTDSFTSVECTAPDTVLFATLS